MRALFSRLFSSQNVFTHHSRWCSSLGEERELILVLFERLFGLVCACLDLSVSSSSWGLGRAAVCDCGTPWTFLLPFFQCPVEVQNHDVAYIF